eukprot:308328-Amphidinium_carterae.1
MGFEGLRGFTGASSSQHDALGLELCGWEPRPHVCEGVVCHQQDISGGVPHFLPPISQHVVPVNTGCAAVCKVLANPGEARSRLIFWLRQGRRTLGKPRAKHNRSRLSIHVPSGMCEPSSRHVLCEWPSHSRLGKESTSWNFAQKEADDRQLKDVTLDAETPLVAPSQSPVAEALAECRTMLVHHLLPQRIRRV